MKINSKSKLLIILSFIILIFAIFLYNNFYYVEELPYRLSKYHTFGKITVTIDGEIKSIDSSIIKLQSDSGEVNTEVIDNGEFRFGTGVYGMNEYIVTLSSSLINSNKDLTFIIEHFNTNWWHVNDIMININVKTIPQIQAELSGYISTRTKNNNPTICEITSPYTVVNPSNQIIKVRTMSP